VNFALDRDAGKKRFLFGNSVPEFGIDAEAVAGKLCVRFLQNFI
jgi:hypothetical protein